MQVLAAQSWRTNGELIADVAQLYLKKDMVSIDLTYGRGLWWTDWRPDVMITNPDRFDFRKVPYDNDTFQLVAFDPPYVAMGGRGTSGLPDFMDRYGLEDAPKTPEALHAYNMDGLDEVHRILAPKGVTLVKCMDYISSGKLFDASYRTWMHAMGLGFELVDRFLHIGHVRTLFVFRKAS